MSFSAVDDRELVSDAAQALGRSLEPAALAALASFADLVASWNTRTNLTGARDPKGFVDVLLADAFVLADEAFIPEGSRVVDVGAGRGRRRCRSHYFGRISS